MSLHTVRSVSQCFVKPPQDLSQDKRQPIYLTPFELSFLNLKYSQKGLIYAKLKPNQDFSITAFLDDLRGSLSATLIHFYPLATRLSTRKQQNPPSYVIYIDPENSPGVKFIHANMDLTVSDILTSADVPSIVYSFFDLNDTYNHDALNHNGHTIPLLAVQVTELTDGIFIGCSFNHVITDGTSFWHFMNAWSEIYKCKEKNNYFILRPPILKRWILEGYDPITSLPFTHHEQFIERFGFEYSQIKMRVFHFSSPAVSKLKAKANEECNTQKISSLQAVSALLWRCLTRARHQPCNSETLCIISADNRRRVKPPMPEDYFGSPVGLVTWSTTVGDLMAHGLGWAALKMHEAVSNHDYASVKEWVESWYRNPTMYRTNGVIHPNFVHIGGSPRFDMYGCEFGLGKAVAGRSGFMNKWDGIVVMNPSCEGGRSMDVEICLLPEYMMDLERDEEFTNALE